MPYKQEDPEVFLRYRGVTVYHCYKGTAGVNRMAMEHWYSWNESDTDGDYPRGHQFDERDLPKPWAGPSPSEVEAKIKRFIDSKLDSPKEKPWNYPWSPSTNSTMSDKTTTTTFEVSVAIEVQDHDRLSEELGSDFARAISIELGEVDMIQIAGPCDAVTDSVSWRVVREE